MEIATVLSARELWNRVKNMSTEAFVARFPAPVLVGLYSSRDDEDQKFATISGDTEPAPPFRTGKHSTPVPESQIFRLTKKEGIAFSDKITVGRTQNNDLVIRDPIVSKLHGFFTIAKNHNMTFTDGGSSNGTIVNDQALTPLEAVEIRSGDILVFGNKTAFLYQDAGDLHACLNGMFD